MHETKKEKKKNPVKMEHSRNKDLCGNENKEKVSFPANQTYSI